MLGHKSVPGCLHARVAASKPVRCASTPWPPSRAPDQTYRRSSMESWTGRQSCTPPALPSFEAVPASSSRGCHSATRQLGSGRSKDVWNDPMTHPQRVDRVHQVSCPHPPFVASCSMLELTFELFKGSNMCGRQASHAAGRRTDQSVIVAPYVNRVSGI